MSLCTRHLLQAFRSNVLHALARQLIGFCGFVPDLKTMPDITKILSGASTALDAMTVARAALAGLKAGQFHINCNLEGAALSIACAGMSPQPSLLVGVTEILSMGVCRIVALFVQRDWYATILRMKRKDSKAKM